MNKTLSTLFGLGLAASVHAAPITFTDIVDPADKKLTAGGQNATFTFTHNILDNGFQPGVHAIQSAQLRLDLADDGDADFFLIIFPADREFATISGDNTALSSSFEVGNSIYQFTVNSVLLQNDGKLNVTVRADQGDFWFKSSTLEVNANAPAAVPEPGTMALMGLGLAGLGLAVRKKKN